MATVVAAAGGIGPSVAGASRAHRATAVATSIDVCRVTGVTTAFARTLFGPHATAHASQTEAATTPTNYGVCDLGSASSGKASLVVELYDEAGLSTVVSEFSGTSETHLPFLGKAAYYNVDADRSADYLVFNTKRYVVVIYNSEVGGQPRATYPTAKQYLALARQVHRHLG